MCGNALTNVTELLLRAEGHMHSFLLPTPNSSAQPPPPLYPSPANPALPKTVKAGEREEFREGDRKIYNVPPFTVKKKIHLQHTTLFNLYEYFRYYNSKNLIFLLQFPGRY